MFIVLNAIQIKKHITTIISFKNFEFQKYYAKGAVKMLNLKLGHKTQVKEETNKTKNKLISQ